MNPLKLRTCSLALNQTKTRHKCVARFVVIGQCCGTLRELVGPMRVLDGSLAQAATFQVT